MQSGLDLFRALVLGAVQGITELFPLSSLAHAVLLPSILRWNLKQDDPSFLPFLVMLHLGTAIALFIYFWRDWWALLSSYTRPPQESGVAENRRILLLVIVGTIPTGLLGLLFQKRLEALFSQPRTVAIFLVLNAFVLFAGEWLRRRSRSSEIAGLTWVQAFGVGISQSIALLPGFSRSGASMVGGLLVGLKHESAARFSFLLATPIIGAAAVLQIPRLLTAEGRPTLPIALIGGVVAGIFAYASTWVLMRYFRRQEVNALIPFGVYCILAGLLGFFAAS